MRRRRGTAEAEVDPHEMIETRPAGERAVRHRATHLAALEAESIFIMREVAAEFERPVLLFSGGKDSIVLLRVAEKAFRPAKFPFPIMHIDTTRWRPTFVRPDAQLENRPRIQTLDQSAIDRFCEQCSLLNEVRRVRRTFLVNSRRIQRAGFHS